MSEAPKQTEEQVPEPRKRSRLSDVIVIVVALVAVLAGTWYAEEIGNFFRLQPWNKGAPVATVNTYMAALSSGDRAALKTIAPSFAPEGDTGPIERIKVDQNPMSGPQDAAMHRATRAAEKADVKYQYTAKKACAYCDLPAESGATVRVLMLPNRQGVWEVTASTGPGK